GVESISRFADGELDPALDPLLLSDPAYVRARGVLRDVDRFDAGFFAMNPREAQLMDPQQRLMLETSWEALEHAGLVPERFAGTIGVFAGVFNNSYASTVLSHRQDVVEQFGAFNAMLLNEKDYVASRVAHKLGLTGPALSIHTACSTSLVAICQAVQSLRDHQCDAALAGGVSLTIPTNSGHLHQEGSMLSADGTTRPFDASATGTVFSDGAGVLVLKRLSDAQRDGDTIYALVRGVAVNNDGANRASFTAPSVAGQAAVIAHAHMNAGVSARAISYVEAHGTATPLGDPIEVEALTRAFRATTTDAGFCRLGSVKSNIGHTVIAAGAAGVIKTALALKHELLPATLHYAAPNQQIDFAQTPFIVNASATPWPRRDVPRMAGVSSFGVGGTNAHVVLEEAPVEAFRAKAKGPELLIVSARTDSALSAAATKLSRFLSEHAELELSDVAHTLQTGRRHFVHRRAVVASTIGDAAVALEGGDGHVVVNGTAPHIPPRIVFMFPGQGAQYHRMGAALYSAYPAYRAAFDRCAAVMAEHTGVDLAQMLFSEASGQDDAELVKQTSFAQPAIYATEVALAALWQSWGITPQAMIGHSVGEFACAAIAGVFSPEEGMRLIAERGRLMQSLPQGSMLSIRLPASEVVARLSPGLSIASDNSAALSVVAGPKGAVAAFQAVLERDGVAARLLHTSHAFHSAMMDPVVAPFETVVRTCKLSAPRIPFVSSVSGTWITDDEARDPAYWSRHLRESVQFRKGALTLLAGGEVLFLEVGPRASLSTFVRQLGTGATGSVSIASLGDQGDTGRERVALLTSAGRLWCHGVVPDWNGLTQGAASRRIPLPTYPFERLRYWVDVPTASCTTPHAAPVPTPEKPPAVVPVHPHMSQPTAPSARFERLSIDLQRRLEQQSGVEMTDAQIETDFVGLGFDSLVLTQIALALSKAYGVKFTFRQLMEQHTSVARLARHLDAVLPPEAAPQLAAVAPPATNGATSPASVTLLVKPTNVAGNGASDHAARVPAGLTST
ncbi:MAG: beta-ketoacyl synthase N-terminal-like domain-containing protein, partial [Gemmatimonadaceae bacterium]